MKKLIVLTTVLAIAAVKAMAAGPFPILSFSGTAVFNKTNYETSTKYVATTVAESVNNKLVYSVLSNAVAGAPNGLAANLPANGYIAYNLFNANDKDASDGNVNGYFFVTNKTGFYYPLSGYTNSTYYSFMELDSAAFAFGNLGFGNWSGTDINDAYSYNLSSTNSAGSIKETQTALLYIHSNPYDYDDLDNPYECSADSQDAIEIRGAFVLSVSGNSGSISLTGAGNIDLDSGLEQGVITSGKATLH